MKKFSRIISSLLIAILLVASIAPAVFAANNTYYVAGDNIFGNWGIDAANKMTLGANGKYTLTVNATSAVTAVNMKVVEDTGSGQNWYGDADGNNITFAVKGAGTIIVTFDPSTHDITISGTAYAVPTLSYSTVTAVGNGSGNFLNGAEWDPTADSNLMTQVEKDVWEIEYKDVAPSAGDYQVKFALDKAWTLNFGGTFHRSGEPDTADFGGSNIYITVVEESSIKLRLDLSNFDLSARTGATFTVTVTPKNAADAFYAVGTDPFGGWNAFGPDSKMTLEGGKYVYNVSSDKAVDRVEFKVVKLVANDASNKVWYGDESGNNVAFGLSGAGRVTVTFDPETEKIEVTGDKVVEAAAAPVQQNEAKQTGDAMFVLIALSAAAAAGVFALAKLSSRRRRIEF